MRYRSSVQERATVERLLAQSRVAVGRQEWEQVEELAGRAAQLRHGLDAEKDSLALAEEVYDASPVVLDPFSRGLGQFSKVDVAKAPRPTRSPRSGAWRRRSGSRALYAARRVAMAATEPVEIRAAQETEAKEASPERRALAAAERGDVEELKRLAEAMRSAAGRPAGPPR